MTRAGRPAAGRQRALLWAPVALLLALQLHISSRSRLPDLLSVPLPGADKLAHAGYFFLLGAFAYRAGREAEGWSRGAASAAVVAGAFVWGVSDEWHQSFVPGRAVEAADLAADVAGASFAALVGERLWRGRRKREGRP